VGFCRRWSGQPSPAKSVWLHTTFSFFSLRTHNLADDGQWFKAGGNAVLSLVLCMVCGVWLEHVLAIELN